MARPKRRTELTTAEKIENIKKNIATMDDDIAKTKELLIELENKKKELEEDLHKEKINLLLETMEEKNISLDMAKEIMDNIEG